MKHPFNREKRSRQPVSGETARALGSVSMGAEQDAKKTDVDWRAIAGLSQPVPRAEKGSRGLPVWFGVQEIAQTKTADGHTQRLLGVLFVASEKLGLVADSKTGHGMPDRFYVTSIGDDQQDGHPLRFVELDQLNQIRPAGYIKRWEDITVGRNADNTIIASQADVSKHHATITVSPDDVELIDTNSTNGVSLFTASLFNSQNFDPTLLDAWNYLQDNPNAWSGTKGAQDILAN